MAVTAKNRQAGELKARANALRAELIDPEKQFTKEEVENKAAEISALEQRAQLAAGFTPDEEIERQGGDELLKRAAPESDDKDTKEDVAEYEQICKQVRRAFGGPNSYLLALAQRSHPDAKPWSPKMKEVHARVVGFHKRTIIGDENDASGGEFLLPLQQVQSIFSVGIGQPGLLERARRYPVAGRTLRIPYLVQTDGSNHRPMSGIAAIAIVGEGGEKPEREPRFDQRLLTVYKWAAYTELGDEVLADDMTGELASTVQMAVGDQVVNEINGSVTFDGTGTAQPLAALHANNAARFIVNRTTSMSVTTDDALAMLSHLVDGPGCFWLAHKSLMPEIFALTLGSNTLVTYLTDLRGTPQAMLLGKPIIWTELNKPLGNPGDLALINPAFYAVAMRQALTVQSSIHYKFRNDITAYRFFARAGGVPIPTGTFSYKAAGGVKEWESSPFVVLGDDVAS